MPREIVHWCVLEEAREAANAAGHSRIANSLSQYSAAGMLGAVAHDAPYYYNYGGDVFEHAAQLFHGTYRNNPLIPMRDAAKWIMLSAPEEKKEILWAMLAGLLSHVATDVVFHPMVIYFTGDYYDRDRAQRRLARTRHRLLEVYLDSWFLARRYQPKARSMRAYFDELSYDREPIVMMLNSAVRESAVFSTEQRRQLLERLEQNAWERSLRDISTIQGWLISDLLAALFRLLNFCSLGKFESLDALTSFGRMKPQPIFERKLDFANPVSGERFSKSVQELRSDAVALTLQYFAHLEELMNNTQIDPSKIFSEFEGLSLEFGLAGVNHEDAAHYAEHGIELPGLRY